MTQQPLTTAEIRLAQYGQRTSTWSTATYNDGTEKALHEIALGLKAEVDRLRAELATEQDQHAYTLRQRNNRSERLLHLRDLANAGDTEALIAAAKDTLAASVNDHKEQQ